MLILSRIRYCIINNYNITTMISKLAAGFGSKNQKERDTYYLVVHFLSTKMHDLRGGTKILCTVGLNQPYKA